MIWQRDPEKRAAKAIRRRNKNHKARTTRAHPKQKKLHDKTTKTCVVELRPAEEKNAPSFCLGLLTALQKPPTNLMVPTLCHSSSHIPTKKNAVGSLIEQEERPIIAQSRCLADLALSSSSFPKQTTATSRAQWLARQRIHPPSWRTQSRLLLCLPQWHCHRCNAVFYDFRIMMMM